MCLNKGCLSFLLSNLGTKRSLHLDALLTRVSPQRIHEYLFRDLRIRIRRAGAAGEAESLCAGRGQAT